MANVRCPICSSMNPPDAEVCSVCGARLKPARPEEPYNANEENEPDWLSSLRDGEEEKPPSVDQPEMSGGEESADQGDMPDWLSRIRERARGDIPTSNEAHPESDEPDWMKG